jgi:pimeloyl-ACP methyl ester carboxylesterase
MGTGRILRDLTARGVRIRVAEAGDGPPLVLLHDLLVNHLAFDRVMDSLAQSYRVLAHDLPGFGESEKPSPTRYSYGIEAFAEAIVDLIAGLELGRVSIIGHSLGGAAAIALAADHPELVDRLILVDAMVYPFHLETRWRLPTLPVVGGFFFKQVYGRRTFRRFLRDNFYAPFSLIPEERLNRYYALFNTPAARESAHAVLHAIEDTRPIVARIPRISAPTLVVWGRHDRMLPAPFGHRLAREIGGARLDVLEAGHAPHEEQPEEFVRSVSEFLTKS